MTTTRVVAHSLKFVSGTLFVLSGIYVIDGAQRSADVFPFALGACFVVFLLLGLSEVVHILDDTRAAIERPLSE